MLFNQSYGLVAGRCLVFNALVGDNEVMARSSYMDGVLSEYLFLFEVS